MKCVDLFEQLKQYLILVVDLGHYSIMVYNSTQPGTAITADWRMTSKERSGRRSMSPDFNEIWVYRNDTVSLINLIIKKYNNIRRFTSTSVPYRN